MNPAIADSGPVWRFLRQPVAIAGFVDGSRYPSLQIEFEGTGIPRSGRNRIERIVVDCLGLSPTPDEAASDSLGWKGSVDWLLTLCERVQRQAGIPIFQTGRILGLTENRAACRLPTLNGAHGRLATMVQAFFDALSDGDAQDEGVEARLKQSLAQLQGLRLSGSNTPNFMKAAYELSLPCRFLPGEVIQFGIGKNARWLNSSFTDNTPLIGAKLARNKIWTSDLLRTAGFPVPAQAVVATQEEALAAARKLGYPVVIKPADLDGGVGVAPGLTNDEETCAAFDAARKLSGTTLLEKHVEGRDYRIVVFNGKAVWAIERVPAGVTGNGTETVAQLVDSANDDPRRATGAQANRKRLVLDDEAQAQLAKQGLGPDSIPDEGRFVRLRGIANIGAGGTPVAVIDSLHPDNARLAVRAAAALHLDLAGIDLLIPDISVSWLESGAAICEVNGQPQLGQRTSAHLYGLVLQTLVPQGGRIPTIAVFGALDVQRWTGPLASHPTFRDRTLGVVSGGKVTLGNAVAHPGPVSTYAGGTMLALSRDVDAMVLVIDEDSILDTGLPVERLDAIILAGVQVRTRAGSDAARQGALVNQVLATLLAACDGVVVNPKISGLQIGGVAEQARMATLHELPGDETAVINETLRLLAPHE